MLVYKYYIIRFIIIIIEASRGAVPQSVTVKLTGCGFDSHCGCGGNEIFI